MGFQPVLSWRHIFCQLYLPPLVITPCALLSQSANTPNNVPTSTMEQGQEDGDQQVGGQDSTQMLIQELRDLKNTVLLQQQQIGLIGLGQQPQQQHQQQQIGQQQQPLHQQQQVQQQQLQQTGQQGGDQM